MSAFLYLARKVRRNPNVLNAIAAPKRWILKTRQRLNPGVFSIEIEATCGFFAVMQLVLFVLKYCEEQSLLPRISARGGLYGEPTRRVDWFAELFEPQIREFGESHLYTSRVRSIADLGFRDRYEEELTLPMASSLFSKFYRVRASVLAQLDELCSRLAVTGHTLGVHYRGTDKVAEARAVTKEEVAAAVRRTLAANPSMRNILLASDEADFVEYFMRQDFGVPVVPAPALHLAQNGKPVHFSGHPGLAIGREALLTCLLLSRCGVLIKTASYLSAWAKIVNPALPVWLLTEARFFPDRALWHAQQASAPGGVQGEWRQ